MRGDRSRSRARTGSPCRRPSPRPSGKLTSALLESEHRLLRQTIATFPADRLHEVSPGAKVSHLATIMGIAAHDVYHAGQIQLLKRLQQDALSGGKKGRCRPRLRLIVHRRSDRGRGRHAGQLLADFPESARGGVILRSRRRRGDMLLDEVLAGHVLDLGRSGEVDRGLCSLFGRDRQADQPSDEAASR